MVLHDSLYPDNIITITQRLQQTEHQQIRPQPNRLAVSTGFCTVILTNAPLGNVWKHKMRAQLLQHTHTVAGVDPSVLCLPS